MSPHHPVQPGHGEESTLRTALFEHLAALPPAHQAQALDRLMLVEGLARALKARSFHPEERAAMARHIAHRQPELGIHPDVLTPEGMSDSQIDALSALALQAAAHIAHARIAAASAEPGGADHPAGHGYVVIGVN